MIQRVIVQNFLLFDIELFIKTQLIKATYLYGPEQPALCYVKGAVLC